MRRSVPRPPTHRSRAVRFHLSSPRRVQRTECAQRCWEVGARVQAHLLMGNTSATEPNDSGLGRARSRQTHTEDIPGAIAPHEYLLALRGVRLACSKLEIVVAAYVERETVDGEPLPWRPRTPPDLALRRERIGFESTPVQHELPPDLWSTSGPSGALETRRTPRTAAIEQPVGHLDEILEPRARLTSVTSHGSGSRPPGRPGEGSRSRRQAVIVPLARTGTGRTHGRPSGA